MKIAYSVSYKYIKPQCSFTEECETLEDLNWLCMLIRENNFEYFRVIDIANGKTLEVLDNFKHMLFDVCKGKLMLVPPEIQYCTKERIRRIEEELKCIKKIMMMHTEQLESKVKTYNIDATITEC